MVPFNANAHIKIPDRFEVIMATHITIRQYCCGDHDAVTQLYLNRMISYSYESEDEASKKLWEQVRQASVNGDLADIENAYLSRGGNFFVATVCTKDGNEEIIGMVGLQRHGDDVGKLRRMSVKEGFRRSGVGRKLLFYVENWARDHGIKRIELSTGLEMTKAVEFYKAHGYTLTHTTIFTSGMAHEEAHLAKDL